MSLADFPQTILFSWNLLTWEASFVIKDWISTSKQVRFFFQFDYSCLGELAGFVFSSFPPTFQVPSAALDHAGRAPLHLGWGSLQHLVWALSHHDSRWQPSGHCTRFYIHVFSFFISVAKHFFPQTPPSLFCQHQQSISRTLHSPFSLCTEQGTSAEPAHLSLCVCTMLSDDVLSFLSPQPSDAFHNVGPYEWVF